MSMVTSACQAASSHLSGCRAPANTSGCPLADRVWAAQFLDGHPSLAQDCPSPCLSRPAEPLIGSPCDAAGVLDLVDDRVTHLFCPSSGGELPTSSLHGQSSQSCAWTTDGQYFCTSGWPVRILDFRPSPLAACAVPTGEFARVSATLQSSNFIKSAGGPQMTLLAALRTERLVVPPLQLQSQRVSALWMCVAPQTASLLVQLVGMCCCSASRERHELAPC